ncbi:MAG: NADH-quinone oxidoreductase subunit NuoH [SAR202 cluster bacterium]|jgi:NADH-quinone oxidoreductase subunit H|nr:NADH-quinone oxidoreductase subunit NuoH [SAR202 cluster bacterium]|tara:strand:- start:203 stop:1402 length:1200 start_codon:yes stop_codon:yes gene_type:complete
MYDIRAAGILDFNSLLDFYAGFLPDDIAFVAAAVTLASVVVNVLVSMTAVYTWFERRALARFQVRLGPNRWGPFGILQPFADLIKLITKEDTTPETADRWVFNLAPIVLVVPGLMAISVIPFGQDTFLGRLNIGILFILGITSINTIAIFMAGWGSANKYAMLGSIRGVAMLVSYEVPMALSVTGVILISGSLAMFDIVTAQDLPFILVQPLSFLIFIAAASAEMSRTPFDQIEAESELGSGYNTEYSSMKFGVLFLAEFMAPLITAMIVTTLFLGGTRGIDPVPGQVWFVLKSFVVLFGLLWVRATWPRLRVDQIMSFAWKGLFGLALLNIFIVAAEIAVFQDEAGALSMRSLAIMSAINWVVTIVALVAMANILGQRKLERPEPVPSPLANMYADGD